MSLKNKSLLVRLKPAIFTGELNTEFREKLYAIDTHNAAGIDKRLRNLGWDGPFSGGKHEFMVRGAMKLPIPNPHGGVLGVGMVSEILRETEISREDWLSAG
jgi:predicted RNA binding protein YcfA (HicA-like mRNA interferase family)